MECVKWALEADKHSFALPLPGCVILSKLLPFSESQLPPYPREEAVPPDRTAVYKVFCMSGSPSAILSLYRWETEAQ